MKNLSNPFLSDYRNVINLFRTNKELKLVPFNWLDTNQVLRLKSLSLSFQSLVMEVYEIWPEVVFVSDSEPYSNILDMMQDVESGIIKISEVNNPSYVDESTNCWIRLGHDLLHCEAFKRWPQAGSEFNTNTELLTYALTVNLVLNSNWTNDDKELFLNFHFSDFVAQTLLFDSLGGFMDIQELQIPYIYGMDWRQFISLPNTELL